MMEVNFTDLDLVSCARDRPRLILISTTRYYFFTTMFLSDGFILQELVDMNLASTVSVCRLVPNHVIN